MIVSFCKKKVTGFTLMEAMVTVGITMVVGYMAYYLMRQPLYMRQKIDGAETERVINTAMGVIISDLKEAYAPSIPLDTLPPAAGGDINSMAFTKAVFSPGNDTPSNYLQYDVHFDTTTNALIKDYQNPDLSTGQQILVRSFVPPTTDNPLFANGSTEDAPGIVVVTLQYNVPNQPMKRLVRRVAVGL